MSKITRATGNFKAFASAAAAQERTTFGTSTQTDALDAQFTSEYERGWGIVGPSEAPTMQDFNAIGFTATELTAYLHQMGVAEWDSAQEYYTGSIVVHAGRAWQSVTDAPTDTPPGTQWAKLLTGVDTASTSAAGIVRLSSDTNSNWETVAATSKAVKAAYDRVATKPQIDALNIDAYTLEGNRASAFARLASPTFTGNPAVPTAPAGTNNTTAASTAFVKTAVGSLFETVYDKLGSRFPDTTYTNSTGKPMMVSLSVNNVGLTGISFTVNGIVVATTTDLQSSVLVNQIVPAGGTYSLYLGSNSLTIWTETY